MELLIKNTWNHICLKVLVFKVLTYSIINGVSVFVCTCVVFVCTVHVWCLYVQYMCGVCMYMCCVCMYMCGVCMYMCAVHVLCVVSMCCVWCLCAVCGVYVLCVVSMCCVWCPYVVTAVRFSLFLFWFYFTRVVFHTSWHMMHTTWPTHNITCIIYPSFGHFSHYFWSISMTCSFEQLHTNTE